MLAAHKVRCWGAILHVCWLSGIEFSIDPGATVPISFAPRRVWVAVSAVFEGYTTPLSQREPCTAL